MKKEYCTLGLYDLDSVDQMPFSQDKTAFSFIKTLSHFGTICAYLSWQTFPGKLGTGIECERQESCVRVILDHAGTRQSEMYITVTTCLNFLPRTRVSVCSMMASS